MITNKNFIGFEAENLPGYGYGEKTLFIGTNHVDPRKLILVLTRLNITRIYFGAGNNRSPIENFIDVILTIDGYGYDNDCEIEIVIELDQSGLIKLTNMLIDQEEDVIELILNKVKIIAVFKEPKHIPLANIISSIKFVNDEELVIFNVENTSTTKMDHPYFKQDKEVDIENFLFPVRAI